MTPERWEQIKRLFYEALEYEPAERAVFLARACGEDGALRRELESLVASHEQAECFIEEPASDVAAALLTVEGAGLSAGEIVAHFRVTGALAAGGMGEVYLADDTRLGRRVALKLLPPQFTADADRVRRFVREARAASALNHPNIVTIHEIGEADSLHFIAAEYVEGETLRERMRRAPMNVGEVIDIATQIAAALSAAHEAGVVHRDIKPENVMLRPDGIVKVLDFGLAKLAPQRAAALAGQRPGESTAVTNPGVVMGTAGYMSPEQARAQEVDARTDIWSLGVVLYEMAAGRAPFGGATPSHVIVSILESDPAPLGRDAVVPAGLERIVSKTLRKERGERYQSAGEMARELKRLKEELAVGSHLMQSLGTDASGDETMRKSSGRMASSAVRAPLTGVAGLATAHLASTAEYLVSGIRRNRGSAMFASAAALVLVASLAYFFNPGKVRGGPIDSLAVLPFVNASGDPNSEYLSEGIGDGVISSLSRLHNLRVISLSTASRYKGRQIDPQQVGRELNVRAVLVGRVARRGDTLSISAELVDAGDNRRLWGEQFHRKPSDVLTVQEEIAGEIAEKLRLRLSGAEKQRLTKKRTESAEAYDAYLRGRFMLEKRTGSSIRKSIEYFEQAIKLDPGYALAYATLSYAYWSLPAFDPNAPVDEFLPRARAAAAKALEIDETLAEAYTALGHVTQSEGDLAGAERAFRRGLELNPNSGFVHSNYSHYLRNMGRVDEAVAESRRAVELEPASVLYNRNLALNLYFARRYDEAIEQSLKTLELDPNMPTAYRWLAKSYERKQLYDKAVEAHLKTAEFGPEVEAECRKAYAAAGWKGFWRKSLEIKEERAKQRKISPVALAETYARLGDLDRAFALLEKAEAEVKIYGLRDPFWDDFRSDPRYADFVRRAGFEL